jgi:hypothetical protein
MTLNVKISNRLEEMNNAQLLLGVSDQAGRGADQPRL